MTSMSLRKMIFASLFTALICVCSFIRINLIFTPVPVTMQFFAVFLAGAVLEMKWSAMSVLIYITLGAVGVPVFSGMTAGPGVLAGPTGGFIIGFLAGVFVISALLRLISNLFTPNAIHYAAAMLAGMIVVYIFGIFQFMLVTRMSFIMTVKAAVLPFVFADCVKLALAVAASGYLKPAMKLFLLY